MREKLTELIVSRYYRGLKETTIADKYKFKVIEHIKSIELQRYDNGDKNSYFVREPIRIELENPIERALSECSYQLCDIKLSDREIEELEKIQEETYSVCMNTLKAEAGVGYDKEEENEKHFLSLFFVDCYGHYESAQHDVFIKDVDRNFLTFVEFSFNITDERYRERIQQSVQEHVQLVNRAIKSKDVEFLRFLIKNSQNHKRVGTLNECSERLDTFEDIMQHMSCVSKKYDNFSTIFKVNRI